jgi:hypothetical protein
LPPNSQAPIRRISPQAGPGGAAVGFGGGEGGSSRAGRAEQRPMDGSACQQSARWRQHRKGGLGWAAAPAAVRPGAQAAGRGGAARPGGGGRGAGAAAARVGTSRGIQSGAPPQRPTSGAGRGAAAAARRAAGPGSGGAAVRLPPSLPRRCHHDVGADPTAACRSAARGATVVARGVCHLRRRVFRVLRVLAIIALLRVLIQTEKGRERGRRETERERVGGGAIL